MKPIQFLGVSFHHCHFTCTGVVLELVTMVTDTVVAPRCVFTVTVGAGSLATLINVCRPSQQHECETPWTIIKDHQSEHIYKRRVCVVSVSDTDTHTHTHTGWTGVFTCTEPVQQSVSRLTGDAAVRALTVDTLLTGTLQGVLALVHI